MLKRPHEEFAKNAISRNQGIDLKNILAGNDPPDYLIKLNNREIAHPIIEEDLFSKIVRKISGRLFFSKIFLVSKNGKARLVFKNSRT